MRENGKLVGGDSGVVVYLSMHTKRLCCIQADMSQLSRNLGRMCSDKTNPSPKDQRGPIGHPASPSVITPVPASLDRVL